MADGSALALTPDKIRNWMRNVEKFDPELADAISSRTGGALLADAMAVESTGLSAADMAISYETMVRHGRPVLPIKSDAVADWPAFIEPPDGELMVRRLLNAAPIINPVIPLVGRIDVVNFPRNLSFIGTAWLVAPDVVVTNSHVAELIGRRDGRDYAFFPGRFGDPIETSVNWKREMDSQDNEASPVERILFIESRQVADIAFLRIRGKSDGARQDRILLADTDAPAGTQVAVIGYPARAGSDVIEDQAWMERVFGGHYDVKRAAPGLVMENSRGWATHDCTTLGGNSGSAVIDLATGNAVALHFAGAYILENYAVPASTIQKYLGRRPWEIETSVSDKSVGIVTDPPGSPQTPPPAPAVATASISFNLPVTISISIGSPAVTFTPAATETAPIEEAVRRFAEGHRGDGILHVRSGLAMQDGRFTDTPCIHVVTHPERISQVQARVPETFLSHAVVVRPATIGELLDTRDPAFEATVGAIAYDDDARTGPGFSFDPVDEDMEVLCHVGPERSWSVLSDFISKATGRMVSSIYEFHANHIAEEIEKRLVDGVQFFLVMDNATRVTKEGVKPGDFDRRTVFPRWANKFSFDRLYAPEGSGGLVANSYHIKVTVEDDDRFWLSSGNWKNSSQPEIAAADLDKPAKIKAMKGNREWHVVVKNKTLADRFRNHILADLKFSRENGGTAETFVEDVFVDVPEALLEAVDLEASVPQILQTQLIKRRVKAKPLLTPDRLGKIYTDAVLELIESAKDQLLFQIPYIDSYKPGAKGNLDKLVTALIKKSKQIPDLRVIMRSDFDTWVPCAEDLKKRGLDLDKCLKHLPKTHTKGMIADGKRVLVGSHNWSGGGVTSNRDASLLFDDVDVAEYYRDVFEVDWARAQDPVIPRSASLEAPCIAVGAAPAPGFRRISLEEFLEG
ncbi:hypothetical protein HFO38_30435 [Rhizobium leguminosarum]|uniref:phospholipase D-like domain-containing protein n=1 Tax=Rhizobium leguminosarum TaxID=384 RepID=UPI001C971756|nr:phospholipase D-like domain-containing protein [Rhizobium leguminosarum]MBY5706972.1 hypothetical protein [Rhizobium leguminosarum]